MALTLYLPPDEPERSGDHPQHRHDVRGEAGEDGLRHGSGLRNATGAFDGGFPSESLPAVVVGTCGTHPDCDPPVTTHASNGTVPGIGDAVVPNVTVSFVQRDTPLKSADARTCYHEQTETIPPTIRKEVAPDAQADVARGVDLDGENYRVVGGNGVDSTSPACNPGINRGGAQGSAEDTAAKRATVTCDACCGSGRSYHFGHLVCGFCGGTGLMPALAFELAVFVVSNAAVVLLT